MAVLLTVVLVVLLANVVVALLAFRRYGFQESWLLVVLLTGTTGAGLVALLVVLETVRGENAAPQRG
ncbi:hypothetical protein [Nesterenkonia massiliensis]|uniref:hypothetical protein n=1 Tax=Nesterenkonia massiliensis TaxID=1232429 RepID=UPI0011C72E24|nr:hypothetical protein [Nesterenkonia massiliensis]